MTSPQMVRLDEQLQRLRLNTLRERLEALLQEAAEKELSHADVLDRLLTEEVDAKTAKHVTMRTNLARFPFIKGLDSFDFGYQPSVDRKQVQKLSLCHFVEHVFGVKYFCRSTSTILAGCGRWGRGREETLSRGRWVLPSSSSGAAGSLRSLALVAEWRCGAECSQTPRLPRSRCGLRVLQVRPWAVDAIGLECPRRD